MIAVKQTTHGGQRRLPTDKLPKQRLAEKVERTLPTSDNMVRP